MVNLVNGFCFPLKDGASGSPAVHDTTIILPGFGDTSTCAAGSARRGVRWWAIAIHVDVAIKSSDQLVAPGSARVHVTERGWPGGVRRHGGGAGETGVGCLPGYFYLARRRHARDASEDGCLAALGPCLACPASPLFFSFLFGGFCWLVVGGIRVAVAFQ